MFSWLLSSRIAAPSYPAPPEGVVIYAVGDIHGRDDLLADVHAAIDDDAFDIQDMQVEVYLGDYVDRGDNSAAVLDRLIERAALRNSIFLRGNHEAIFQSFLERQLSIDEWRQFGGIETCISYGCDPALLRPGVSSSEAAELLMPRVPAQHLAFLATLQDSFVIGDYFFVHAGVRPGLPLGAQSPKDLHWIREGFLDYAGSFGKIIVHGHSPVKSPEFRVNRINIDTGAFATNRLTCLKLDEYGVGILEPLRAKEMP
jgi:serine/threonine protein phosphatase 1